MSRRKYKSLLSLVFLTSFVNIESQPAPCNDDIHCSVGFFCHTVTQTCRECLSCELMKRRPAPKIIDCIKSVTQCGPCFQGLTNGEGRWGGLCMSPEQKNMKQMSSYVYLLATFVATGILLSIFIMHGIYSTPIIQVKIAIPSHKKPPQSPDSRKITIGFTA